MPLVAFDEPCTIGRRALQALADNGIAVSVVCEAGHLAGAPGAARGLGVALVAHAGPAPDSRERYDDLPAVQAEPLQVRRARVRWRSWCRLLRGL